MITIAFNPVTAKIVGADRAALNEVHRLLSYSVDGSDHMAAFKSGDWNGKSSFFSYAKQTFPAGFVRMVVQGLRKLGLTVNLRSLPVPEPLGPVNPVVDEFGYTERYDYQPETVETLVRHRAITVQVATGGGKSRIARMALKRIDRPALFLTTRGILMYQMHEAIEKMEGKPCAILGDGEWGIPYTKADGTEGRKLSKFTVGMVQTLAQRLEIKTVDSEFKALRERRAVAVSKKLEIERKKLPKTLDMITRGEKLLRIAAELEAQQPTEKEDRAATVAKVEKHERLRLATMEILAKFELVIVEEAHEVSSDGFYTVMAACRNAHYRMALTATPFMKDDEEANMRLLASCGPVAVQITEKMLIERGILAKPYFKYIELPDAHKPKALYRSTPWQKAYPVGIVENEYRNKRIVAEVMRARLYGLNAMVLVQHKAHGELLRKMMVEKAGLRAEFIYGEDNQSDRKRQLQALGRGDLDALIGSTILDVGVDVPSVGIIILAGGGKAEVATRQRIGRGLREKKAGPNVAFIVDFADDFNTHLKGHYLQRRAIVKGTPGFAENVVPDFDYAALGFTRAA
jgi:superfamily II DNA or RNA helicase